MEVPFNFKSSLHDNERIDIDIDDHPSFVLH